MSTLADRLRGIVRPGGRSRADGGDASTTSASGPLADLRRDLAEACHLEEPFQAERPALDTHGPRRSRDGAAVPPEVAAELLGGEWADAGRHRFLVIDRTYRPGHRHGRLALLDHVLPDSGRWRDLLLGPAAPPRCDSTRPGTRALFVDLETTGLAGGAGTYAFLVGCGWFEGVTFRIRQLFLSSYPAERNLLESLAALAAAADLVVSYNGKSFDLPLIDTRFVMNRMSTPFTDLPHLDMLHHARRLWRADHEADDASAGCRLADIERTVCGHEREGDVPGFEIPARYFHFVRTGDPRPLADVLEHNRLDILSLAFLTARAAQLADEGPAAAVSAREAVGLGRVYERAGRLDLARACFARVCGLDDARALPATTGIRAQALRAYAVLCRRVRQYRDAAFAWQQLVELPGCPPQILRDAVEALAVHHEHRLRDPGAARTFAIRSMPLQRTSARQQALQHRLARLERKLDGTAAAIGLF